MEKTMEENDRKLSVVVAPEKNGNAKGKESFWHINKNMLPFKIHFFFFIGGMGAILPYLSAFGILKLGLTATNLAVAFTAQQVFITLLKPCVGYIADYFNRLKAILIGLTVLQAIFTFCMIMIPTPDVLASYTLQPSAFINGFDKCQLCKYTDELKYSSLNKPFKDDLLRQILKCYKDSDPNESDYVEVYCPNESLSHANVSYQIMHTTCNKSLEDFFSSINQSNSYSLSDDFFLIKPSFESLQNSFILCLLPKGMQLFDESFSYDRIKKNCQAALNPGIAYFHDLAPGTLHNTTNCPKSSSYSDFNYEHNAALSAAIFKSYQFWVFSICLVLSCVCISSIFTISDTACYESVQGADYGVQRAWGAISWGVVAPFAGFLNDYTDSYVAAWCLMVVFCCVQIWNLSKMDLVKPDFSQNIMKDLKTILSSMEFLAFEAGVFMNGVFTGVIWFYLTWFLTTIGGNKLVIGLAHTVQCFFGEVPFFFISGWLIKWFGHFHLLSLGLVSYAIRFFIYSYLHNAWFILPIECLHGFTFGSFYAAMTSYGKMNSKPGTEATTQSVLCTTYEGIGAGIGCVISGICFDYYGGHQTFFYLSFVSMAATLLNVMFTILVGYRKDDLDVTKTITSDADEQKL